jgi:hypothetical protein
MGSFCKGSYVELSLMPLDRKQRLFPHMVVPPTRIGNGSPVRFVKLENMFNEKVFGCDVFPKAS